MNHNNLKHDRTQILLHIASNHINLFANFILFYSFSINQVMCLLDGQATRYITNRSAIDAHIIKDFHSCYPLWKAMEPSSRFH